MTREVPHAIQVLGFIAACWMSGVLGMAWDSFSVHVARHLTEEARIAVIRQDGYDLVFRNVCPTYFDANWVDRNLGMWNLRWCKAYEGRV